jgi:hypothetical protein
VRGLFFLIIVVAALGVCAGASAAPVTPVDCTVAAVIAPDARVAQITDTQSSSVDFAGAFVVTGNISTGGYATFAATTDTGWPASVEPASQPLDSKGGGRGHFTLRVFVPAATPADTVGHVTLTATANAGGQVCAPDEVVATVQPQSFWSETFLRSDRPFVELQWGEHTVPITVTLNRSTNRGGDAPVSLRVLTPAGIHHDAPSQLTLRDNGQGAQTATVVVTLIVDDLPPGLYTVRLMSNPRGNSTAIPGSLATVSVSSVFVRIPDRSPGLIGTVLIAGAAVASVAAAAYLWRRGRPGAPP